MAVALCSTGTALVWLSHAAMSHDRWVADGEDLSVASKPRQWIAAVYYVTATITTARARLVKFANFQLLCLVFFMRQL